MSIKELIILPTNDTPSIILKPGDIIIKGRSMKIIEPSLFSKIEEWLDKYISDPADDTTVEVYLEYLNTGNIAYYNNLLRKLVSINSGEKKMTINWYTEEGDEDMIEKGEYLSEMLNIQFNFETISDHL
jgi:hypothetical protein